MDKATVEFYHDEVSPDEPVFEKEFHSFDEAITFAEGANAARSFCSDGHQLSFYVIDDSGARLEECENGNG